ncbi:hypothetical protein PAXRUDRAFT_12146 [Paxillus rubicundulus Ve08.2h10]|uniref:hAT-like transposase RNase-H fold domain-containing protein n=1 Tax=Paxillus rubicundulus Ve08.2h10 TaxID=930991 RepID=A0A0D0DAW5_9AGAM|nr:hypothetical protein PAXRUDRAFT_12146 [Paxillus rubicundulus Ve08.2h10]
MFDMLEYALKHRKAIDTVTQWRGLGLRKFELADHEWELVEQLHSVLKILKDATLFFSHATPNLATVIPVMDHIDEKLTTHSLDPTYTPAIHTVLGITKKTLNRYYQLTDSSEVYWIAMILHPQHKPMYFKAARWEEDWIKTAEGLVQNKFKHSYSIDSVDSNVEVKDATASNKKVQCF